MSSEYASNVMKWALDEAQGINDSGAACDLSNGARYSLGTGELMRVG